MKKIFKINEEDLKPIGPRDPSISGVYRATNVIVTSGESSSGIRAYEGRM